MRFSKMHGLGNDFVVVDCVSQPQLEESVVKAAARLCDRHFGIGADGVLIIGRGASAALRMRIINADGSEAEMCGNGIRCLARYAYEHGLAEGTTFAVETLAGIITPTLELENGHLRAVTVDMGQPRLQRAEIPMSGPPGKVVNEPLAVDGQSLLVTCVSMGNPHCVTFVDDVAAVPLTRLGPAVERHPAFPHRTNVEFVQVENGNRLKVRVWERGAGETLACGSGACASLVAAVLVGRSPRRAQVELPGGPLAVWWREEDDHLLMSGPAVETFAGEVSL